MGNSWGITKHELTELIGKKIKRIYLQELDINGDGRNIRQFYRIICSDAQQFILACDGGNEEKQYATVTLMDRDDFEAFLEEIQLRNSESSDYDLEYDDSPYNEDEEDETLLKEGDEDEDM